MKKVEVIIEKQKAQAAAEAAADAAAEAAEKQKAAGKAPEAEAPKAAPAPEAKEAAAEEKEAVPEVTIDDFARLQFKIGEIVACEKVKKSKKLLCSQVKIGDETRQILSGIAKYYTPEEMVGKKVMVITNLKPARLAGMESQGMILCAEDAEGNVILMTPEKDIASGSEIC